MIEDKLILGIKLSHDGSVCLFKGNQLVFCYEIEKVDNKPRYSGYDLSMAELDAILSDYGYCFKDVSTVVVDGWHTSPFSVELDGESVDFEVADYAHLFTNERTLDQSEFHNEALDIQYKSYQHISGHIYSAYCSSPFAKEGQESFILVWDGMSYPQMFYYTAENKAQYLDYLFPLSGFVYTYFAVNFDPYKSVKPNDLSLAGKYMAYIAKGVKNQDLLDNFHKIFNNTVEASGRISDHETMLSFEKKLLMKLVFKAKTRKLCDEDILTTFHHFLEDLLVRTINEKLAQYPDYARKLCYAGGCALNIKWNSSVRTHCDLPDLWVPPFPNDAGSSIGAVCCELIHQHNCCVIEWDVYSGPILKSNNQDKQWQSKPCSISELAAFLHESQEPVVLLNGRAELGPRSLGNRSIIASTTSQKMKEKLNFIKKRESYRPVAPICMEEHAPEYFSPGSADPYMLFDHKVNQELMETVPAICHLDGTARLQTVSEEQNLEIYTLLNEYRKLSGIPMLCNTSANYNGSGFFPDVKSVMDWGRVDYVWHDSVLYQKIAQTAENEQPLAEA